MRRVALTVTEGERITRHAYDKARTASEGPYESLPDTMRVQAVLGAIRIVEALQDLGYRVSEPLEVVK